MLRAALQLVEWPYAAAMACRNGCYDRNWLAAHRLPVPVVSVGNLTLGGTGKTPLVGWLARWFATHSIRVAVVSRGYGARPGKANDEAMELKRRLPDIIHLQNPDRVAAAREAIEQFAAQVIVLDDAFQHRRIARDLDIVLVDALEPFGFEHVFPRGTLREPLAGLRRAHVVALSRSDMLDEAARAETRDRVRLLAPHAAWLELTHHPLALVAADGRRAPLETLIGQPLVAFCGLGNPAGFRHTLRTIGYTVTAWRDFPDHHVYTPADLASLAAWADGQAAAAVVCTHKDLVKLTATYLGSRPLWAVEIGLECTAGGEEFQKRLQALLPRE